MTYTKQSGACPDIPDALVIMGGDIPDAGSDCAMKNLVTSDPTQCTVAAKMDCKGLAVSVQMRLGNADATRVTGILTAAGGGCMSTYALSGVKQ